MTPSDAVQRTLLQLAEVQVRAAEAAVRAYSAIADMASAAATYMQVAKDHGRSIATSNQEVEKNLNHLISVLVAEHKNGAKPRKPARRK